MLIKQTAIKQIFRSKWRFVFSPFNCRYI